jgi:copper transporter 1
MFLVASGLTWQHQAYLILAVVVGAAIGHYVYGGEMDVEAVLNGGSSQSKGMACH